MAGKNRYYTTESKFNQDYPEIMQIAETQSSKIILAMHKKLHREVAVKLMNIYSAQSHTEDLKTFTLRFVQEAAIATQLNHPNIIQLYDVGYYTHMSADRPEVYPLHYIVMEYIKGLNLNEAMSEMRFSPTPLTLEEKLAVFDEICDPVEYAHGKTPHHVIHRDLKPGNILLGRNGHLKIADFGIAKVKDTPNTGKKGRISTDLNMPNRIITQDNRMRLTIEYAAPEQFTGDPEDVDVRTDIFALGGILYFMLTGRSPYSQEDLNRRRRGEHGFQMPGIFPAELKNILHLTMAERKEDRFSSVQEVRTAARAYLNDLVETKKSRKVIFPKDTIKRMARAGEEYI